MKISNIILKISAFLILLNIGVYFLKPGSDNILRWIGYIFPVFASLFAGISLLLAFIAFKSFDRAKICWLLLFFGVMLLFAGELSYTILELVFKVNVDPLFPTVPDYFWGLSYFPLFAGFIMIMHSYKKSGLVVLNRQFYLILAAIFLIALTVLDAYLFSPIVKDEQTTPLAKSFYLFYIVGDLLLIVLSAITLHVTKFFGKGLLSWPWRYLAFGFILITIADITYSYLNWSQSYDVTVFSDIAWNFGYLLIAVAGISQAELLDSLYKN